MPAPQAHNIRSFDAAAPVASDAQDLVRRSHGVQVIKVRLQARVRVQVQGIGAGELRDRQLGLADAHTHTRQSHTYGQWPTAHGQVRDSKATPKESRAPIVTSERHTATTANSLRA